MTQKWIYYDPAAGSGYYWAGVAVIGNYVVFGNTTRDTCSACIDVLKATVKR
jgi:hypothetical protein